MGHPAHKKSQLPEDIENAISDESLQLRERIAHLQRVSLFSEIASHPVALAHLAKMMKERIFAPGANIITEGQTGTELFLLINGDAGVHRSTLEGEVYKVAILHGTDHSFFGEGGLLDSEARSATITAESDCLCLVLERSDFEKFCNEYPQWALPVLKRITQAVMARLRKSSHDLILIYNALVTEIRGGR